MINDQLLEACSLDYVKLQGTAIASRLDIPSSRREQPLQQVGFSNQKGVSTMVSPRILSSELNDLLTAKFVGLEFSL